MEESRHPPDTRRAARRAPYAECGRWFLADRATRSIAPGFTITPAEVEKLAAEVAGLVARLAALTDRDNQLLQAGNLAEAKTIERQMLDLVRARDGQESAPVSGQLIRLAVTLIREGKYGEAEQLARECLAIREKLFPAGNFQISAARRTTGQALAGQERYGEAEPLLLTAYEEMKRFEASAGLNVNQRAQLATTAEALAQLYEATGRPEKAEEWRKFLATIPDQAPPPPAPAPKQPE